MGAELGILRGHSYANALEEESFVSNGMISALLGLHINIVSVHLIDMHMPTHAHRHTSDMHTTARINCQASHHFQSVSCFRERTCASNADLQQDIHCSEGNKKNTEL